MLSKASFDLDQFNNPVIKLEIASTPDVRDKIARRFVETFGHGNSQWCEIFPTGEAEYMIFPVKSEELRKTAEYMLAKAYELDKYNANPPVPLSGAPVGK